MLMSKNGIFLKHEQLCFKTTFVYLNLMKCLPKCSHYCQKAFSNVLAKIFGFINHCNWMLNVNLIWNFVFLWYNTSSSTCTSLLLYNKILNSVNLKQHRIWIYLPLWHKILNCVLYNTQSGSLFLFYSTHNL